MWGGGDGSSDVRSGSAEAGTNEMPTTAAGAAGVAGVSGDEQLYGRQPGQPDTPYAGSYGEQVTDRGKDVPYSAGGTEEVMEDPWAGQDDPNSGWFGGDESGDGGGWGDIGGGDWS